MHGFHQIFEELEKAFPDDWWIISRQESNRKCPDAFPEVQVYESALSKLDQESWLLMSKNVRKAFAQSRNMRGKDNFFCVLNEALAYEYLINEGFENVRLVPAGEHIKSPDISYEDNGLLCHCEVKTICVSDHELIKRSSNVRYNGLRYIELNEQFFGKFDSTILNAVQQIKAASSVGLVYLVINFDDCVLDHYETYKHQLVERLREKFPSQGVLIRAGEPSPRYIQHFIEDRKTQ